MFGDPETREDCARYKAVSDTRCLYPLAFNPVKADHKQPPTTAPHSGRKMPEPSVGELLYVPGPAVLSRAPRPFAALDRFKGTRGLRYLCFPFSLK